MQASRAPRLAAGIPAALLAVCVASALASAAPGAPGAFPSWIVRLDGPTVWELRAADGQTAGPTGGHGAGAALDAAPAVLEARRRTIETTQDAVASAVADLGGTVVDRYQVVYNGLVVHAAPEAAAAIAGLPGVVSSRFLTGRVVLTVEHLHIALPAVLQTLEEKKLELANLSTHHATLEDVFVTLTGRALRE